MRIKPGDTVIIPFMDAMPAATVEQMKAGLGEVAPGVRWEVLDGCPLTHALVYEGTDTGDEELAEAVAAAGAMAFQLETSLDLLQKIVSTFTEKSSIGGIGNVRRSSWHNVTQVEGWQAWIDAKRKALAKHQGRT